MSVEWDFQGFPRPVVDMEKCVLCGKCRHVCPVASPLPPRYPRQAFALRIKDSTLWEASSSGGAFTVLAMQVLKQGGAVFGAAFSDGHNVILKYVEDTAQLDDLRRSKYVYSYPREAYLECRELLTAGRLVFFCALPCQIAALKHVIENELQKNLITADMICHGVPSPRVFLDYLTELAIENGKSPDDIADINFRRKLFLNRSQFSFSCMIGNHEFVEPFEKNLYLLGFAKNLYLKEACHHCSLKNFRSGADYTLADFWGISQLIPEIKNTERWSLVLIFNDRLNISAADEAELQPVAPEEALKFNRAWKCSPPMHPRRKRFWKNYSSHGVSERIARHWPYPMSFRIRRWIASAMERLIERLTGTGAAP